MSEKLEPTLENIVATNYASDSEEIIRLMDEIRDRKKRLDELSFTTYFYFGVPCNFLDGDYNGIVDA